MHHKFTICFVCQLALVCDVLLNRICSVDEATNRVGECLPLATYHDMISEDIVSTFNRFIY